MQETKPAIYKIEYPFGTLIVDEDIYYRITKDKSKRPYHKYKAIRSIDVLNGIVRCRVVRNNKNSLARMLMQPGRDEVVDHINRNPLDNRRCNLRIVSPRQNSLNRTPKSSTGYIGVSITHLRGRKRLQATFKPVGARLKFSLYDTPANRIICALVHDKFVIQSGDDEYAPLNFVHLRNEPFRSKLLKMDISEFRENNLEFFTKRFHLPRLAPLATVKNHFKKIKRLCRKIWSRPMLNNIFSGYQTPNEKC